MARLTSTLYWNLDTEQLPREGTLEFEFPPPPADETKTPEPVVILMDLCTRHPSERDPNDFVVSNSLPLLLYFRQAGEPGPDK
jgi:hypothetical protein